MNHASEIWIEHFRSALRWRRRVEQQLLELPLTLTQWLALDALETLHERIGAAVSQAQIGRVLELDRATVSDVMDRLSRRRLVARAPGTTGSEWGVSPTDEGERRAAAGRLMIDVTSKTMLAARSHTASTQREGDAARYGLLDW
jgi:DNA-binding MarR family transcriptional regulator